MRVWYTCSDDSSGGFESDGTGADSYKIEHCMIEARIVDVSYVDESGRSMIWQFDEE